MGKIPDKESFIFMSAEVDVLQYNFTDQLKKCIRIEFRFGSVKSVYINPKLNEITLFRSSTENVIIKRNKHYQLEVFWCNEAKLTQIPENIDQLEKLKVLYLDGNLIETVQLDQFNGLNNLDSLSLSSNNIKHIYSDHPVSVPSLTNLYLTKNRLQHFNVCSWNMTSLSGLYLSSNNLRHFAVNRFRGLKELIISGNPLNCVWKNRLLKKNPSEVVSSPQAMSCDKKSIASFGLDCAPTNYELQQLASNIDSRLTRLERTVSRLGNRMLPIGGLLKNLHSMSIEQQNVSNDIIEALYRIEIERASQTNKSP
ncbi:hypothetical protein RP20_CCG020014 [Aedes albopictus]|nr:hypothetical protein RP20_CCG020014 [Aedes albopictus]